MGVPLRLRLAYPLSFVTGLLYWLAFPGMDVWPLSFIALVPLIVALAGQRPKHGFWLGWTAGFAMTVTGFYFLSYTLQEFSGFPLPLCFLFQAVLAAFQAGRIGLFGWLATRGEQGGYSRGLTLALAFAASEQVYPLLFKWFYAATVHQVTPLIQVAELGGPIAVSLVVLGVNYALAELVLSRLQRRSPRKLALGAAAAPVLAALYGFVRMPAVDARSESADKVEVGLVQANMSLSGKRNNKREGLDRHLRLTNELKKQTKLDLVVWSETSVMSAVLEDEAEKSLRQQFTRSLGVPALFGSVLVRPVQDAREYALFNSALLTDKRGRLVGRFDKQLLLAFGEYLPFGDTFPILYQWSPHSGRFQPGTSFKPLTLGDRQIAVMICYEDLLPQFINRMVSEGEPELLANLTNDAWFGDTTEPWIHLALAKFRAVEQRKYFVRSTNSGVSAFIDPNGRVISHTDTFVEASQHATLRWLKGKTPYSYWGDAPWYLVAAASLALALRKRRSPATPPPPPADVDEPVSTAETNALPREISQETAPITPAGPPEDPPPAELVSPGAPVDPRPGFPKPREPRQ
jgi:apolipoprotein N-acyltransferase